MLCSRTPIPKRCEALLVHQSTIPTSAAKHQGAVSRPGAKHEPGDGKFGCYKKGSKLEHGMMTWWPWMGPSDNLWDKFWLESFWVINSCQVLLEVWMAESSLHCCMAYTKNTWSASLDFHRIFVEVWWVRDSNQVILNSCRHGESRTRLRHTSCSLSLNPSAWLPQKPANASSPHSFQGCFRIPMMVGPRNYGLSLQLRLLQLKIMSQSFRDGLNSNCFCTHWSSKRQQTWGIYGSWQPLTVLKVNLSRRIRANTGLFRFHDVQSS